MAVALGQGTCLHLLSKMLDLEAPLWMYLPMSSPHSGLTLSPKHKGALLKPILANIVCQTLPSFFLATALSP